MNLNQRGLTLIETLVTLAILTIIIGSLFGVLINSKKTYTKIAAKSNLSQEANIILSTIRNYQLSEKDYKIKYIPREHKAYIGETSATLPLFEDNFFIDLDIENIDFNIKEEQDILVNKPLNIKITLFNKTDTYEIETTINKY